MSDKPWNALTGMRELQAEINAAGLGDPRDVEIARLRADVARLEGDVMPHNYQLETERRMAVRQQQLIEALHDEIEQLRAALDTIYAQALLDGGADNLAAWERVRDLAQTGARISQARLKQHD